MQPVNMLVIATGDPKDFRSVYMWGGILIGLVLLAYFAYSYYKKWMNDVDTPASAGFALSDLRKLRDEGKISSEEYELTRGKMVAAAKRVTGQMPDAISRRPGTGRISNDQGSKPQSRPDNQ